MQVKSVTETVLHNLRVRIIVGELAPGSKLNEQELSSAFGISRAPLREAFRLLESEQLVIYYPRRGCYVTEISLAKCREIYQVRAMMECFSVDLLKAKGIKALPEVESAIEETVNLTMPTDGDAYKKYDYLKAIANFHIRLVETAENAQLTYFYHSLFPNLARYQSLYTYISGLMNESYEEHKQFLRLAKNSKYDEAKDCLKDHINKFVELVKIEITDEEKASQDELPN